MSCGGKLSDATPEGRESYRQQANMADTLCDILSRLEILVAHMEHVTDLTIKQEDLEDGD